MIYILIIGINILRRIGREKINKKTNIKTLNTFFVLLFVFFFVSTGVFVHVFDFI